MYHPWGNRGDNDALLPSWPAMHNLAREGVITRLEFNIVFCGPWRLTPDGAILGRIVDIFWRNRVAFGIV